MAEPHGWDQGTWDLARGYTAPPEPRFRVVAYDSGIKQNILRQLASLGCGVTVVPARTPTEAVLEMKPHGVFLSNGPGDPEAVPYLVESVRGLVGRTPIFGICLGNQILGLALGGRTYKLKFGHHGANHPVRDLSTGRVEITAQNHGFSVDPDVRREARPGRDPRQPERRDVGGHATSGAADLLGAVSPGGLPRPARCALPVPPLHRPDERRQGRLRHACPST